MLHFGGTLFLFVVPSLSQYVCLSLLGNCTWIMHRSRVIAKQPRIQEWVVVVEQKLSKIWRCKWWMVLNIYSMVTGEFPFWEMGIKKGEEFLNKLSLRRSSSGIWLRFNYRNKLFGLWLPGLRTSSLQLLWLEYYFINWEWKGNILSVRWLNSWFPNAKNVQQSKLFQFSFLESLFLNWLLLKQWHLIEQVDFAFSIHFIEFTIHPGCN